MSANDPKRTSPVGGHLTPMRSYEEERRLRSVLLLFDFEDETRSLVGVSAAHSLSGGYCARTFRRYVCKGNGTSATGRRPNLRMPTLWSLNDVALCAGGLDRSHGYQQQKALLPVAHPIVFGPLRPFSVSPTAHSPSQNGAVPRQTQVDPFGRGGGGQHQLPVSVGPSLLHPEGQTFPML
jgi:hypothetical protein